MHRLLRFHADFARRAHQWCGLLLLPGARGRMSIITRPACAKWPQFAPDVVFIWRPGGAARSIATEAEGLPGVATATWLAGRSPACRADENWLYWEDNTSDNVGWRLLKPTLARVGDGHVAPRRQARTLRMQHVAAGQRVYASAGDRRGVCAEPCQRGSITAWSQSFSTGPCAHRNGEALRLLLRGGG